MSRRALFDALFAQIAGTQDPSTGAWSNGWQLASQTMVLWKDVSAEQMPAFFLAYAGEKMEPLRPGAPVTKNLLEMHAWVYVTHMETNSAMDMLGDAIDVIQAAIRPAVGQERQTLGGLVYSVTARGEVHTDEGALGDQAMAMIPITIVASP